MNICNIKDKTQLEGENCWRWLGATGGSKSPRPQIRINGKCHYVARIVWELVHEEIPTGMLVCHRCDNPLCVNPEHLFLGSQRVNMRDASSKGRFKGRRPMNAAEAGRIRALRDGGMELKAISQVTGVPYGTVTTIVYKSRW